MFSWYKYLIVSLVFSHLGFWSGSLFLIAPFPDLCLLVLFFRTFSLCISCVRGSPMVPLVGNMFTICTNLMVLLVKKLVQNVKMVMPLISMVQILPSNGTIGRTPTTRIYSVRNKTQLVRGGGAILN